MSKFVRTVRVKHLQYVSQANLKTLLCRTVDQGEPKTGQSHLEGQLSPVVYQGVINGTQQPNSCKRNIDRHTSSLQAEIYAIIACSEINLMKDNINQDFYINSDSHVARHTLTQSPKHRG